MECRNNLKVLVLSLLLATLFSTSGCTNPEKAKAAHLSRGEAYLAESKFQEASIEFRNAIQIDDRLAAAHWGLARAYEGMRRLPELLDALKKTVELDPNNLEARIKLGNFYLRGSQGRAELIGEAERLAKEILQKDPNHIEAHILMGSVLFAQNDREKAFAALNRAIELDPKRVESYLSLARFYMVTDDPGKAEETYKRAISVNVNSALAHTEYGRFLIETNRNQDAEVQLRRAVELEPANRNSHTVLAGFYFVTKQFDKAEAAYKTLSALDPDQPDSQAILADFYASIRRFDDAVRIYQDILAKSPDYRQGRYRLGEIMLNRGDNAGAKTQIEELLKNDQRDRQALLLRARMRLNSGQSAELKAAIEDLKEVLKQEPNSRVGLYFMAQANLTLGVIDQARTHAADLERAYPDYLPAKIMQVQISLASGDPNATIRQATDLLNHLNKTTPDRDNSAELMTEIRVKALIARGTAQTMLRKLPAARQDFAAARELAPQNTDIFVNLANVALSENKLDEATGFYEQALAISATDFNALTGLINLYAVRKQLPMAHARLDQVLSSYPNSASLHYLKAQIYGHERNQTGLESELRKTLELDSNYVAAYSALGAMFINTNQQHQAIAEYKKIIELHPDNSSAYTIIGMLYDNLKDYDSAAQHYRKALELDPNSVIAANNLAWLYAVQGKGNIDEAVRLAQGVVQRNPQVASFLDTLGWIYYKKGLNAVAIEHLQKAVSIDDTAANRAKTSPSPTYRFHLGMALKAKGDNEAARRELEVALRLADKVPFPYADEARQALATL